MLSSKSGMLLTSPCSLLGFEFIFARGVQLRFFSNGCPATAAAVEGTILSPTKLAMFKLSICGLPIKANVKAYNYSASLIICVLSLSGMPHVLLSLG